MLTQSEQLQQRADYTHKYNTLSGRHGWLRLTPAYSLKVVEEILSVHEDGSHVLEPFSGTATTGLSAAYHGHKATCLEINPFLVWLGRAKVAHYTTQDIQNARRLAERLVSAPTPNLNEGAKLPPIHNIERWWPQSALAFLSSIRQGIDQTKDANKASLDLLKVAFCRTLIKLSNAAFNHQSMSFKSNAQSDLLENIEGDSKHFPIFLDDVNFILRSSEDNPIAICQIVEGDARHVGTLIQGKFDLVITSPPYPNRMSYIRELRPYMYWMDFLSNGREAGELDWQKIGGTWGIATSRLVDWIPNPNSFYPPYLKKILDLVSNETNKNGGLLANYIRKYFEDIWDHLCSLRSVLSPGAELHYIVGNSTFYGIILPVEKIYADMMSTLGFEQVETTAIRKRNSKKELIEFDVSARMCSSR